MALTPVTAAGQSLVAGCAADRRAPGRRPGDPAAFQPDRIPAAEGEQLRRDRHPRPRVRRRSSSCAAAAEKLTVEFLVDTSDTLEDVRDKLRRQAARADGHQRTSCTRRRSSRFVWDRQIFVGVLESLDVTLRAVHAAAASRCARRLATSLKEYRPVDVQVSETPHHLAERREELRGAARRHAGQHRRRRLPRSRAVARDRQRQRHPRPADRSQPGTVLTIPALCLGDGR